MHTICPNVQFSAKRMPKLCYFVQKLPIFVGQFPQMLYLCSGFQVILFKNLDAKPENETQNYYI